ncbi:uncharacterized protein [Aegilops tauschii subsp. strangulata]|uniref:uncharacterized protein n=1 Tax=Aegilops tauschii subsp. strangulata TaxID=200361 RepID=UPI003CC87371
MPISPTKEKIYYAVQLCFRHGKKVSNNITEYEGLIAGLRAAVGLRVKCLTIKGDSQLHVNFCNKEYKPKDEHVESYLEECQHVPRGTNKEAHDIAKRASRREPQRPGVFEERLHKPSTAPRSRLSTEEFKAYLLCGTLPEKEEDAKRVVRQATAYCLEDDELYRRCTNDVSMWCISEEHRRELLADIDGGDYGNHSSLHTLVGKVFPSGFY